MPQLQIGRALEIYQDIFEDKGLLKYFNLLFEYDLPSAIHSRNVGFLSILLGIENQIEDLDLLGRIGLLHDIGKIKIYRSILNSNQGLTSEQREIINSHVKEGCGILKKYDKDLIPFIENHHKFDNRKNNYFNSSFHCQLSQILAVTDQYEALRARRSYKKPLSLSTTEIVLREQCTVKSKYIDQIINFGENIDPDYRKRNPPYQYFLKNNLPNITWTQKDSEKFFCLE